MHAFLYQGLAQALQHPAVRHSVLAAMHCHLNKSTSKDGEQCSRSEVMCMHFFTNTTCDIKGTDADDSIHLMSDPEGNS